MTSAATARPFPLTVGRSRWEITALSDSARRLLQRSCELERYGDREIAERPVWRDFDRERGDVDEAKLPRHGGRNRIMYESLNA